MNCVGEERGNLFRLADATNGAVVHAEVHQLHVQHYLLYWPHAGERLHWRLENVVVQFIMAKDRTLATVALAKQIFAARGRLHTVDVALWR